jgi:Transposase DDE domain
VFGQIKQARGFRQFLMRGIAKMRAEWAIVSTAHNLLKLAQESVCGEVDRLEASAAAA